MKLGTEKQILITGCYRSGTEYITLLLNNNPNLSVTMYTVSFMRFCYNRYNPVNKKENYTRLVLEASERIKNRWNRDLQVDLILKICQQEKVVNYALLYDLIMCNLFVKGDIKAWGEKVQLAWTKIPGFLDMYPDGKVIHIIRDPRSVLASFKNWTYAPEPAYLGAIFNCYDSMKKGLAYRSQFDKNNYILIKFEDFLQDTKSQMIDLFNFIGISSNHNILSEEGWLNEHGKPWHHNSAFINKKQKIKVFDKRSAVYGWKNHLNDWEITLCEHINSKAMEKLGYPLSGIQSDWEIINNIILKDDTINKYYQIWQEKDEGVEEFPTDPLNPKNWTENALPENNIV
jgi:hypothetical protein